MSPCFHLLCSSFLCLSSVRSFSFTQACLLPPFLDFLAVGSLEEVILKYQQGLPDPPFFPVLHPKDSSKQISEKVQVCSPEVQGCVPAFFLDVSSLDPEICSLMLTVAKASADFHISDQFFLVPSLAMHLYLLALLSSGFDSMSIMRYQQARVPDLSTHD